MLPLTPAQSVGLSVRCGTALALLVIAFVLTSSAQAAPDISDKFSAGTANATEFKPQSKLWHHDGSWWTIVYDGSAQKMYRFQGGDFVKQTYADASVDSRSSARADVLWDGTWLYVLMWHATTPRFYKYTYDVDLQQWQLLSGFPVDIPISSTEVMVFDKDSTGRLWISYEKAHEVRAIWTTTPDHLTWNTAGTVLAANVGSDDITTTIAFDDNKLGVFWSDQTSWRFGFRYHNDADAPEIWSPLEIVDSGSAVDDHINAACDASGRVFVAAKDTYNHTNLYMRSTSGSWTRIGNNLNSGETTRPIVMVDNTNNALHVAFTDWEDSPDNIYLTSASLSSLSFNTPTTYLTSPGGSFLNNVSGSKSPLDAAGGLMLISSSSSSAYWGFTNQDEDDPVITALDPKDDEPGVALLPTLRVRVADSGMGVDASSIVMLLDGAPITPTLVGSSASYELQWTAQVPLQEGHIYNLSVSASDNAYPAHTESRSFQFKTEYAPAAIAGRYNFQPQTMVPPAGWNANWGKEYTLASGIGWNKGTVKGREGATDPDPLLDTYVDRRNSWGIATCEFDVPNGLYSVTVVAGSPITEGKHGVEIEDDVLLSGQTTDPGQYITVADYEVAVTDAQLSLRMGGIGGSKKTQICYIAFDYIGPVPPDPPGGTLTAPAAVAGLQLNANGTDVQLAWDTVTEDIDANSISVSRYAIYRGSAADFTADRSGKLNRIGLVSDTAFTDINALAFAEDMYYLVTAERSDGTESPDDSALGIRRRISLTPTADSLVTWIGLPGGQIAQTAADLVSEMNGGLGQGAVTSLSRIDALTQQKQSWEFATGSWSGSNFPLVAGEAYEIIVKAPLGWNSIGVARDAATYAFTHNSVVANLNWISLPLTSTYSTAQGLVNSMNNGTNATHITKVARLDHTTGTLQSLVYFKGGWRGNDFPVEPGVGVLVLVGADLPAWSPTLQ